MKKVWFILFMCISQLSISGELEIKQVDNEIHVIEHGKGRKIVYALNELSCVKATYENGALRLIRELWWDELDTEINSNRSMWSRDGCKRIKRYKNAILLHLCEQD